MASVNLLCSHLHNFSDQVTQITKKKKKKRNEVHTKIFCGPSKFFKNVSWPINICLKFFMASAKTLRVPPYILNVRSLQALKRTRLFLNGRNYSTLVKALSFLLDFEQILYTCLWNFSLLSDVIPRSLTSLLSQSIPLSNFAYICLFLFPDIKRWHLSALSFM